jgi:hypothetical protein
MLQRCCITVMVMALVFFTTGQGICDDSPGVVPEVPALHSLETPAQPDQPVSEGSGESVERKSVARAMILSAVLPGLGQIYAGGRRGVISGGAMAATDVFSIWRYFANNAKGDDKKGEYEDWSRDHFSRDRFERYVRDTVVVYSGYEEFDICTDGSIYDSAACWENIDMVFPLSETGSGAYYEQLDIDDRFVFGWDDWDPYGIENHEDFWVDWDPFEELPSGLPQMTTNRQVYQQIRSEAEDFYGKADRWAWIMVIGRVVSMVDAAILVKVRNRDMTGFGGNPRLTFHPKFGKDPGFRITLKLRF